MSEWRSSDLTKAPDLSTEGLLMWFLLRTVFWLSIVFAFIFWPKDQSNWTRAKVTHGVQDFLGRTAGLAQAEAERMCLHAPAACVEGASHLSHAVVGHSLGVKDKAVPRSPVVDLPANTN
jgi:hypothetical protein